MKVLYKILSTIFTGILFIMVINSAAQEIDNPGGMKKYAIDNCVSEFSADGIIETSAGYQFWFVDKDFLDGRTLKMSVVEPYSATHQPHKHAEDEFFFVLEGTAEFYLDGETKTVGAYASFYCPPNIEHGIRNAGNSELKYLVIKKYDLK
ncbi:MAG: cupin domain-containing protein [Bacteroidales bacterium]|nr:cupin domain-containing protein [Bacteroidales bacterium]